MSYYEETIREARLEAGMFGNPVDSRHGPTRELLGMEISFDLAEIARMPRINEDVEYKMIRNTVGEAARLLRRDPSTRAAAYYIGRRNWVGEEVECLVSIQYLLRSGKLNAFLVARSLDLGDKLPLDALRAGHATGDLAKKLGCGLGVLKIYAASAHVYV